MNRPDASPLPVPPRGNDGKRKRGRPRMREVPETMFRNINWLYLHTFWSFTPAEIARHHGVSPRTVRLGIRDAKEYRSTLMSAAQARRAADWDDGN